MASGAMASPASKSETYALYKCIKHQRVEAGALCAWSPANRRSTKGLISYIQNSGWAVSLGKLRKLNGTLRYSLVELENATDQLCKKRGLQMSSYPEAYKIMRLLSSVRQYARDTVNPQEFNQTVGAAFNCTLEELRSGVVAKDADMSDSQFDITFSLGIFSELCNGFDVGADSDVLAAFSEEEDSPDASVDTPSLSRGSSSTALGSTQALVLTPPPKHAPISPKALDFVDGFTPAGKEKRPPAFTATEAAPSGDVCTVYKIVDKWAYRLSNQASHPDAQATSVSEGPSGLAIFMFADGTCFHASNILFSQVVDPRVETSLDKKEVVQEAPGAGDITKKTKKRKTDSSDADPSVQADNKSKGDGDSKASKAGGPAKKKTKPVVETGVATAPVDPMSSEDLAQYRKMCASKDHLQVQVQKRPKIPFGGWIVCVHDKKAKSQLVSVQSNQGVALEKAIENMNKELEVKYEAFLKDAKAAELPGVSHLLGLVEEPTLPAVAETTTGGVQHDDNEDQIGTVLFGDASEDAEGHGDDVIPASQPEPTG
eukprot:TRINITY_DN32253_c0_g1_i1.p1 TRINITY_DN32253_c0_g1~~TRINITY_DN32253_c0_g1_i1.p1  ORF type:complete len:543 (+),score=163.98 TRINITY_DN32253_c0_g1_i1:69-1697(+)